MSDIIETYQQEQKQLLQPEMPGMTFAAVVSVNEDGLELQFDGEETASTKRFPCNTGVSFAVGQRVLLMKVNGSYVALCPVGLQGIQPEPEPEPEHYDVFSVDKNGLVPGPTKSDTGKFLRGDGSWVTVPEYSKFTTSENGLVPASGSSGASKYLKGDGTWGTPSGLSAVDFQIDRVSVSTGSVAANGGTSGNTTARRSGYTPLGIVGIYCSNKNIACCAATSNRSSGYETIYYYLQNASTSAQSGTLYIDTLWVKVS